ncbi:MAG: nucleotidyl transferase AbiEii/AbiGii toxin family protein [Candidatus Portnoybacteria bacterium]|nr:nucleotidyl transferase AbiEii/AbiGii toxin family protein [Candidatus Portnoybacteria bacterium]
MHPEALAKKNKEIFPQLNKFNDFYLAGGTALALQIGHRVSIDFDFFSENEISKNLLSKVKRVFSGTKVKVSVNNPDELTVFIDEAKITFLKYPFLVIFDLIDYQGIKLLSPKEIAAAKAYTIGRRGSYKDYIDLYFIISEKHSDLNEIIEIAEKKYQDEFNSRLFLEQLVYLEDIKANGIDFLRDKIDKKILKEFFEKEIKKIEL